MIKECDLDEIKLIDAIRNTTKENKYLYGEVYTPLSFVENVLDIIPKYIFSDPHLKWLDPGSGTGNFSIILYYKLLDGLESIITNIEWRKTHILQNMMYMIELREENVEVLKKIFGENANIYCGDFLSYNEPYKSCIINNKTMPLQFDIIIGNPPFNSGGLKKVPTNDILNKKNDGITIWDAFVIKSLSLLKDDVGKLCVFIPSLWLKPDKKGLYKILMQYNIQYLHCFSNTTTNTIFKGNAQTPSCYFLLTKQPSPKTLSIYDYNNFKYISYYLTDNIPIPVFGQEVIRKLKPYIFLTHDIDNSIKVTKTNMPPKGTILLPEKNDEYKFSNITTCRLDKNNTPNLIINYSIEPLVFHGVPKLILAHKMYGFPYLDISGEYGISNRDNYVIIKRKESDLIKLQKFLSTKTALYLFEATRYRMKYLERYAFQLIPDITRLPNFPKIINDKTIAKYFEFDELDIKAIESLHKKQYKFFV